MKTTQSPFTQFYGSEILINEVTAKAPADLIIALFAISMCFGLDRTEAAIKATFTKDGAAQVISGMNLALSLMPATIAR